MASPQDLAAYYENFPTPPGEPTGDPNSPEYQAAKAQYDKDLAAFEQAKAAHEEAYGPAPEPPAVPAPATPGAGMPAARLSDLTAHGGIIAGPGCPTVLIGNMPAARLTDLHTCPMVSGLVPHVGGPITAPGAPTVLIGYMPAARVSDQATCAGGPDVIALGEFTVMIGS